MSPLQSLVRLVPLPRATIDALHAGDLAAASANAELDLPVELLDNDFLWEFRSRQLAEDPTLGPWLVRAIVRTEDGVVVGYAGFHGAPDDRGMIEVGYTVIARWRGRGYAQSALGALLAYAAERKAVRVVRASVSPDNDASMAVVGNFGFELVGEQWDERDGLELILERSIRAQHAGMHD